MHICPDEIRMVGTVATAGVFTAAIFFPHYVRRCCIFVAKIWRRS